MRIAQRQNRNRSTLVRIQLDKNKRNVFPARTIAFDRKYTTLTHAHPHTVTPIVTHYFATKSQYRFFPCSVRLGSVMYIVPLHLLAVRSWPSRPCLSLYRYALMVYVYEFECVEGATIRRNTVISLKSWNDIVCCVCAMWHVPYLFVCLRLSLSRLITYIL